MDEEIVEIEELASATEDGKALLEEARKVASPNLLTLENDLVNAIQSITAVADSAYLVKSVQAEPSQPASIDSRASIISYIEALRSAKESCSQLGVAEAEVPTEVFDAIDQGRNPQISTLKILEDINDSDGTLQGKQLLLKILHDSLSEFYKGENAA
mmetsp:Transcript_12481/g.21314  ORF Transcript_12481/g.21314 Transcript_12481/m.21314 type:complete len:157 (-) Transcript_12481:322-792(-)